MAYGDSVLDTEGC